MTEDKVISADESSTHTTMVDLSEMTMLKTEDLNRICEENKRLKSEAEELEKWLGFMLVMGDVRKPGDTNKTDGLTTFGKIIEIIKASTKHKTFQRYLQKNYYIDFGIKGKL